MYDSEHLVCGTAQHSPCSSLVDGVPTQRQNIYLIARNSLPLFCQNIIVIFKQQRKWWQFRKTSRTNFLRFTKRGFACDDDPWIISDTSFNYLRFSIKKLVVDAIQLQSCPYRILPWIMPWLLSPNPNDRADRPPENMLLENRADLLTEHVPLEAGFSACLCRSGARSPGESLLRYICYPIAQEVQVRNSVCDVFDVFRYGYGNSLEPLCPGELIYLELRRGLEPIDDDDALVKLR